MENLDHLTLGREDLVSWCCRWKNALLTNGSGRDRLLHSTSNLLVKINDIAVVKFGSSVTSSEAANQSYAYNAFALANLQARISAPKVYRYFEHDAVDGRIGYLVMEHIRGTPIADLPAQDFQECVTRVSTALRLMWQLTCDKPGPVDGGEPCGTIWAPDSRAYETLTNKRDLERWFDRAVQIEDGRMDLAATSLVFCHLDLAARNVILGEESVLYLIDWASAGFYPRTFEIWALHSSRNHESKFPQALLSMLPQMDEDEERLHQTLWQAYRLNMLHNWSNKLRDIPAVRA